SIADSGLTLQSWKSLMTTESAHVTRSSLKIIRVPVAPTINILLEWLQRAARDGAIFKPCNTPSAVFKGKPEELGAIFAP
ncbi:MAG: hypothetical protein VCB07_00305, partial [Gammaproteobacteria bacterium]